MSSILRSEYKVKADAEDFRDLLYTPTSDILRKQVDLRQWASPIENQSNLGSCVGNSIAGAYELLLNQNMPAQSITLSRLFIYYNSRVLEETVAIDSGAYIRDGVKSLKKYGICSEQSWPYNVDKFTEKPSDEAYTDAKKRNIKNYFKILTLDNILDALNHNHPIVSSLLVYSGFHKVSPIETTLSMPEENEEPIGGHAMCIVGYDIPRKVILARNSFGPDWCREGYCWIPFEYVRNEFMDNWIFDIDVIV